MAVSHMLLRTYSRGAFKVVTATHGSRTAKLRYPALRPLISEEISLLSDILNQQTDVIAHLCSDMLHFSNVNLTHGGLLEPKEASRLRPVELITHEGNLEPPAWCEQGRPRLISVLSNVHEPVRLIGVTSTAESYWIYTDERISKYIAGLRIPEPEGLVIHRLLHGS